MINDELNHIWDFVTGFEYKMPRDGYQFDTLKDLFIYMADQAYTIGLEFGDREEQKETFFKAANFVLEVMNKGEG